MNYTDLKSYATQARRDFIRAVTERAALYGVSPTKIEPATAKGDVVIIRGSTFPASVVAKRQKLIERINLESFDQTMEALAYTWFNRFVAIRFMELHGYLEHGYRVLSHPDPVKKTPEILELAEHVDLPGLRKDKVIDLKLDGNKESELYQLLLLAQCHALHSAMPFLFEGIDDETELLLPDNLLHSDSLVRKLVTQIPEDNWLEVEIIGWLYQYYISEKKDQVIGAVVQRQNIPAATQLFTPHWIVKYLVQNSIGRHWMASYSNSPLKAQMEYYIEPSEQPSEVRRKVADITTQPLDPEELKLLDPACGSGHILVEAYDLLKAIYLERGYLVNEIPTLILQKNLYGLEIDDRAAQLSAFALLMKARADDAGIFKRNEQPRVLAIQESTGLDPKDVTDALNQPIKNEGRGRPDNAAQQGRNLRSSELGRETASITSDIVREDVSQLIALFEHGKTLGSLIRIPEQLAEKIAGMSMRCEDVIVNGGMLEQSVAKKFGFLLKQAAMLATEYDVVVTNPPYLHTKNMPSVLKGFANDNFSETATDTFEMFVAYWLRHVRQPKYLGIVSPFTWMFLSSFAALRQLMMRCSHVQSLIQLEYNAFEPACVPVCTFVLGRSSLEGYRGDFIRLSDFPTSELQPIKTKEAISNPTCGWRFISSTDKFRRIPGSVFAYWLTEAESRLFEDYPKLSERASPRQGLITGDNDRFLRLWFEVSLSKTALFPYATRPEQRKNKKWFPYQKGGPYRKWYGNHLFVVDWENDGKDICNFVGTGGKLKSRPQNISSYFKSGATWSSLTSGSFAFRFVPEGFIFDAKGPMCFAHSDEDLHALIALGNLTVTDRLLSALAPTLDFSQGPVGCIPWLVTASEELDRLVRQAIACEKSDWDAHETSWDFTSSPLLKESIRADLIADSMKKLIQESELQHRMLHSIESAINECVSDKCGLCDSASQTAPTAKISLFGASPAGSIRDLVSYAVGCILGRYSLDHPGLIYAHGGNEGFDPHKYRTFTADDYGIVPVTEFHWFEKDAANQVERFIATAWPKEHLEENLRFVARIIGQLRDESPRETIRRYLATEFYKDHLRMYKGPKHPPRPIYWLFCSGKERAFQALVYIHRYYEGTLSRVRTEYVIPLQGKIASRLDQLSSDIQNATSTSHLKKMEKEQGTLLKQRAELQAFDEKLRHYADKRINLDLDDGVKVTYAKFGDLLAEVKTVIGGGDE